MHGCVCVFTRNFIAGSGVSSAETVSSNEPHPLTLDDVLVPTAVTVNGLTMTVHVPGCYNSAAIKDLEKELTRLHLDEDVSLQAYLSLPHLNAHCTLRSINFHLAEDLTQELDDRLTLKPTYATVVRENLAQQLTLLKNDTAVQAEALATQKLEIERKQHKLLEAHYNSVIERQEG